MSRLLIAVSRTACACFTTFLSFPLAIRRILLLWRLWFRYCIMPVGGGHLAQGRTGVPRGDRPQGRQGEVGGEASGGTSEREARRQAQAHITTTGETVHGRRGEVVRLNPQTRRCGGASGVGHHHERHRRPRERSRV